MTKGNGRVRAQLTDKMIRDAIKKADGNLSEAARLLGVKRRTFYDMVVGKTKYKEPLSKAKPKTKLKINENKKTYFITSAQNNTAIDLQALESIKGFSKFNNAQILVIPVRYKNVTAFLSKEDVEISWPAELTKYYLNNDVLLNNNLGILASVNIQATTINPLAGIQKAFNHNSAILGHNQISFKTIASAPDHLPRQLYTTGTLSHTNYSDTLAGFKAKQHHGSGGCIVEVSKDKFLVRHIEFNDDGSFYDLEYKYLPDGKRKKVNIKALALGDLHCDFVDDGVVSATLTDSNSIVKTLKPEYIFIDDALDFYSQNHHHKKNIWVRYGKRKAGMDCVESEINRLIDFHNRHLAPTGSKIIYTDSNHNNALARWLKECDIKHDMVNFDFYHRMQMKIAENIEMILSGVKVPNPLELYALPKMNGDTQFISGRKSFNIDGVEYSQHGDKGLNGGKGNLESFSKTGVKMVIRHSHTPGRKHGVLQTGTSSRLDLEYVSGFSSWLHSHVIQYENGALTHLNIIDGKWR